MTATLSSSAAPKGTGNLRIARIVATRFRGIPAELSLDLRKAENATPCSLLLTGDNGTGKSSIVDAIEFALQANIGHSKPDQFTRKPSLLSLAANGAAGARLTLSDGRVVERSLSEDEDGLLITSQQPHPAFSISPMVLRRSDILRFLQSSEADRKLVFWNYLRKAEQKEWPERPHERLDRLKEQRLRAHTQREEAVLKLATKLECSPESLPRSLKTLDARLRELLLPHDPKGDLPPDIAESLLEVQKASSLHRKLKTQIAKFDFNSAVAAFPKELITALNSFFAQVAPRLTEAFKRVSPVAHIERFTLAFGEKIGQLVLDVGIDLDNGRHCSPWQLLSEANMDLLALLFFVAVSQESATRGQAKVLILDDVLQSIDATIRVNFMEYLLSELRDWQIIVTAHDRLWQTQLRELFGRAQHQFVDRQITRWSFSDGPVIRESNIKLDDSLSTALSEGDVVRICSEAGLLLEMICDALSARLPISVTRRRHDRYTLGDLFPGVRKALKDTAVAPTLARVDRYLSLRNLLGAHYNEWAHSLSLAEAQEFGNAVRALIPQVRCATCVGWIEEQVAQSHSWSCRCGALQHARSKTAQRTSGEADTRAGGT